MKFRRFDRRFPWVSLLALVFSLAGIVLFSVETYKGAEEIRRLSDDVFAFLIPWVDKFQIVIVVLAIVMVTLSFLMTVVGLAATYRCRRHYKNIDQPSKQHLVQRFFHRLGHHIVVAFLWTLAYLLNICWLGILSLTVVLTSAYFAFLPVCLPQAGFENNFCFNFTLFSLMVSNGNDANMVSLILCGGPVDKFCKISRGVMPWFWGSFAGCIIILLGLSYYNAHLAANFANSRHGKRYKKLHARYGGTASRLCDGSSNLSVSQKSRAKEGYLQNGHAVFGRSRSKVEIDDYYGSFNADRNHDIISATTKNGVIDDRTKSSLNKRLSMALMNRF